MSSEVNIIVEGAKIIAQLFIGAFGAFYGYKVAAKKFTDTTRDSDKNIFTISVTNERAVWRGELRESIANYVKLAYKFVEEEGKLSELSCGKSHIIMRLNPKAWSYSSKHALDFNVLKSTNSIYIICENGCLNAIRLKSEISNLEKHAQKLLKHEWEKSKTEAVEGRERDA